NYEVTTGGPPTRRARHSAESAPPCRRSGRLPERAMARGRAVLSKNGPVQERRSVLRADGTIAAGAKSRMEEELLLDALRWMMKSRLYDQRVIAAQLPQATGLAWGLRLRGQDSVVITYIGDGGSSEGDFHEALNLAGVVKAPIVFFLQNNQWAISTSRRVQSATKSFALRAAGYG